MGEHKNAQEWGDKTDGTYACCRDGYLAAAEPREKKIEELKAEIKRVNTLFADIIEAFISCSYNDDFEMAQAAKEIYELFYGGKDPKEVFHNAEVPKCSRQLLKEAKEIISELLKKTFYYWICYAPVIANGRKEGKCYCKAFYDCNLQEWETNDKGYLEKDEWVCKQIIAWCEIPRFTEECKK